MHCHELDLLVDNRVHNVFYVSRLEKALGRYVVPSYTLPPLDDEGMLELILEAILYTRERHLCRRIIRVFLVK